MASDLMTHTPRTCTKLTGAAASIALGLTTAAVLPHTGRSADAVAQRVEFPSADGKTKLVGYVFMPASLSAPRVPAVVMMHGRAGAYSSLARGRYDATTLSQRHQFWGRLWADHGYIAVMVDGFGPRGYAQGFPRFTYRTRPAELDEVTIRPLDAYGALAWLRARKDVLTDRIGLHGWSNGGSATLAAMAPDAPGIATHTPAAGFRAALAFYPACGLKDHFAATGYSSYAPTRVYIGTADEEVSPRACRALIERAGGDVQIRFYRGATHDFDDPGRNRQRVDANAAAREDVIRRAPGFFAEQFGAQNRD
jgi:carboxymethylenebutenolidase